VQMSEISDVQVAERDVRGIQIGVEEGNKHGVVGEASEGWDVVGWV
jgi:hypothetical protein